MDIKVDSSVHKGMPFKHYHGRTGVVFNVNKRAVGVEVNKEVNGRIIKKQIHVAMPHLRPSKCRDDLIKRIKENEEYKAKVRAGEAPKKDLKRKHAGCKAAYFYNIEKAPETIQPAPYVDLV